MAYSHDAGRGHGDNTLTGPTMRPAIDYASVRGVQADALFASALQRSDQPDASQVRHAVAAAVRAFGYPGCAERVAQEFGEHPETAVIRMRWARDAAREAFGRRAPAGR